LAAGPPTQGLYAHYEITEELGKGSFATVMKALCRENGHWYAVKMIHNKNLKRSVTKHINGHTVSVDPSKALHKEVQILQRLQHPNICQLKEVYYEENYVRKLPYSRRDYLLMSMTDLVLEWVSGGDLLEYILKKDGLSTYISSYAIYTILT
jgi:ser/thr/tyr protein kinase RAD53